MVRRRGEGFSSYLSIRGLRKGPGKFLMGVLESPGKVLDFFVSTRIRSVERGICPIASMNVTN